MKALIQRMRTEESGQVIVLVSICMTVLLGMGAMVADVGQLYLERQRLVAAADLAALAGAQLLPDRTRAEATAADYLAKNGVDADAVQIEINDANSEITVNLRNTIPTTFARVLGVFTQGTWGGATAQSAALSGVSGAAPLGVAQADWRVGQQVILKASSGDTVAPGNYQALALGDKGGASRYEDNLANGFDGMIRTNQWISTEPGNMVGPTIKACEERLSEDPNATWQTVKKGSPRLLKIPVVQDWNVNGRGEVKVVGFAIFFLESVSDQNPNKGEIRGRFLRMMSEGEADGTAGDFGLSKVRLVH